MGKSILEKVYSNIQVDLYYDDGIYEATVKRLSSNSLYIYTDICPPRESNIEVVLIMENNIIKLRGKVKRTENINELNGIGVELFSPTQRYFEFILNSLDQKQSNSNKESRQRTVIL